MAPFKRDPSVVVDYRALLSPTFWLFGLRVLATLPYAHDESDVELLTLLKTRSWDLHETIFSDLRKTYPILDTYRSQATTHIVDFGANIPDREALFKSGDSFASLTGYKVEKIRSREELATVDPLFASIGSEFAGGVVNREARVVNQHSHNMCVAYSTVCGALGVKVVKGAEVTGFR
jgi:hypothetical protein